jgi:hypothetical protein
MLRGHVDAVSNNQIAGWAADDAVPSSLVDVSIFVNDTKIAQVTCDRPRLDLKRTLLRDELDCGFRFTLDPSLDLNRPHRITVRFTESGRPLPGGDVMLANASSPPSPPDFNARPPARFLPLPTPDAPRALFDLLRLHSPQDGLYNLLCQIDLADRSYDQIVRTVFGGRRKTPPAPEKWSAGVARDTIHTMLRSRLFQSSVIELLLHAYSEKHRLLFVHIPKCAGTDLSYNIVTRYPSIHRTITSPMHTSPQKLVETLIDTLRMLPYFDTIYTHGHVNLAEYEKWNVIRPTDEVFTIVRPPLDIALSRVNYFLTRLKRDAAAGVFQPDTKGWLKTLGLEASRDVLTDDFLAGLSLRLLHEQKMVTANPLCQWLGGGTAEQVVTRLEKLGVEVTNMKHYAAWLAQRWAIRTTSRANESIKFLSLADLSSADVDYLHGISQEDTKLYGLIEGRLARSDAHSVKFATA